MRFTELAMAMAMASGGKVEKAYRGKTWSESVTRTLIQLWGDETIQIALSSCKSSKESSQVYKSLLTQLEKKGIIDFTTKEIINKIKKLRQKYKAEKDKINKSGNSRQRKWQFFDEIDAFLSQRHNVTPPCIADTMAENISNNTCHNEVDELGKKYGQGFVETKTCSTCQYEMFMDSEGVHVSEGGSVKVYSVVDEFCCPNCGTKEQNKEEEVENEEVAPQPATVDMKIKVPPKKKRKTTIEKTLDVVFQKFKENSNEEFSRYQSLEEKRLEKEHEFRLQQQALENQRRREEREHEMAVLRMLTGYPITPSTHSITNENSNTYFQL